MPLWESTNRVVVNVTDQAPRFFNPDVTRVKVGDSVVFSLSHDHGSGAAHTVTAIKGPELFDSGVFHWSYQWKPSLPGEYTYICAIHPYMKGVIAVEQDPSVVQAIVGEGGVWPPDVTPLDPPAVPGEGEVWVDVQWYQKPERPEEPGAIAVVDAATWQLKRLLPFGNNPHNLGDSPDGRYVYQSSWHGNEVGIYDRAEERWAKILRVGNAPAHVVVPQDGRAYVSVNAESYISVINPASFTVERNIQVTGKGPHGMWADSSGRWLVAALTLSNSAAIVDLEKGQQVAELPVGQLPLAAYITADGKKAYIPSALDGTITVLDVPGRRVANVIRDIGALMIQVPFTPDDRLALVAVGATSEVAVIDVQTDQVIKRIPVHLGAHGVTYGRKQGGGLYAYVTHKYADILSVIDMDTLSVAGEIKMPAAGGNGIAAIPNVWR